jgi:hypothetical protein
MDSFYITAAVLVVVGGFLIVPLFTCSRRASAEVDLKPLWQERCTGKMGALAIGIPAIRVALYQDFMVIGFLGQTVIPYGDIADVTVEQSLSFLGASGVNLRLKSMRSAYHFNSRDPKGFAELIESHLTNHSSGTR